MPRIFTLKAASTLIPLVILAGCAGSGPDEKAFIANAEQQFQAREQGVCLQLPSQGDYTSFLGGLQRGWIALLDVPGGPESYYGNRQLKPRLDALASAGVLSKEPYELMQGGVARPASRYRLTEAGRQAMGSGANGDCLQVGQWTAKQLTLPRSGVKASDASSELIKKKQEGDNVTYEAWVSFELTGAPAWAAAPAVAAAYPEQLAQAKTGRSLKVELVNFNRAWVSKQVLARKMANSGAESQDQRAATLMAAEIPADLHEMALAKLNAQGTRGYYGQRPGASFTLPVQAGSETPGDFARQHPGTVFLALTADPQAMTRSDTAMRLQRLAERERVAMTLLPEQRAALLEAVARERASLTAAAPAVNPNPLATREATARADRFLNTRRELREVLEALVEAGAYVKKEVAKEEVAGAEQNGVLYTPAPGTVAQDASIALGTPRHTRIVKQQATGPLVQVTVEYVLEGRPQWADALGKKLPGLAAATGTRMVVARPDTSNAEFPYTFLGY